MSHHRIGVVSDTHIPGRARALPAALLQGLAGVELILHAGDILEESVLEALRAVAPVQAVAGNNDCPDLVRRYGWRRVVEVGGRRIGLVHGHIGSADDTPHRALEAFAGEWIDAVVFGHSHIPLCREVGGVLLFNPGSPTDRRRQPHCTYGLLHIAPGVLRGEIIAL